MKWIKLDGQSPINLDNIMGFEIELPYSIVFKGISETISWNFKNKKERDETYLDCLKIIKIRR